MPEIAGVGLNEAEALEHYGAEGILIGHQLYWDTAKGKATLAKDYFVKVIIERKNRKILGAQIIGPQASVLIQEIINLMNTPEGTFDPIQDGMHIHPALSEVVERAFGGWRTPEQYQNYLAYLRGEIVHHEH